MTQDARSLESTFQRAWTLLSANPIVVVPGLIVSAAVVLIFVVAFFAFLGAVVMGVATGSSSAGVLTLILTSIIAVVFVTIVAIVQAAFVTGMAGVAWDRGRTTLGDGLAALRRSGFEIFLAMVLLALGGIVALLLAPLTLTLSLWAYLIFTLYALPAVILGGHSATHAIAESWHMALSNFWPTAGVAAIVVCLSLLAAALGSEVARLQPIVGSLTGAIVQQAAVAYATLVIVGEYLKLHPAELPAPSSPGPGALA